MNVHLATVSVVLVILSLLTVMSLTAELMYGALLYRFNGSKLHVELSISISIRLFCLNVIVSLMTIMPAIKFLKVLQWIHNLFIIC